MLKSLCGPLAKYVEVTSSSPVLCVRRSFFDRREPGLSSISVCCGTESENKYQRKLYLLEDFKIGPTTKYIHTGIFKQCIFKDVFANRALPLM